jgi:broad specificity phosphatase PhoE
LTAKTAYLGLGSNVGDPPTNLARAIEMLAGRATPGMIVVAHGGVLTAALGSMLGREHPLLAAAAERPFTKLPALANCSVTQLEWPGPRLVAFNETGHLD